MKILLIPLTLWLANQTVKFITRCVKNKTITLKHFTEDGGMPSSHTVLVTSLAMTILLNRGWDDPLFAISFVLSAIVVVDSFNLRQTVERQSKALNLLRNGLQNVTKVDYQPLTERAGHKFFEVVIGGLVGIIGAALLNSVF